MNLFKIFSRKKETKPQTYIIGKVGDTNQKLVEKEGKLFIQQKKLLEVKEIPIKPFPQEIKGGAE